jgi:hypothetical protein
LQVPNILTYTGLTQFAAALARVRGDVPSYVLIGVERLVPRAVHQRPDRPEIDQREPVRIGSLSIALLNATVRDPDRARRLAVAARIAALPRTLRVK